MTDEPLKPCPFCGCNSIPTSREGYSAAFIECNICQANVPRSTWNRRAPLPGMPGRDELLNAANLLEACAAPSISDAEIKVAAWLQGLAGGER